MPAYLVTMTRTETIVSIARPRIEAASPAAAIRKARKMKRDGELTWRNGGTDAVGRITYDITEQS